MSNATSSFPDSIRIPTHDQLWQEYQLRHPREEGYQYDESDNFELKRMLSLAREAAIHTLQPTSENTAEDIFDVAGAFTSHILYHLFIRRNQSFGVEVGDKNNKFGLRMANRLLNINSGFQLKEDITGERGFTRSWHSIPKLVNLEKDAKREELARLLTIHYRQNHKYLFCDRDKRDFLNNYRRGAERFEKPATYRMFKDDDGEFDEAQELVDEVNHVKDRLYAEHLEKARQVVLASLAAFTPAEE